MKLVWTQPAVADLRAIRDYIRRDSEFYARRFVARILDAVETLAELPTRGRPVPEADDPDIMLDTGSHARPGRSFLQSSLGLLDSRPGRG